MAEHEEIYLGYSTDKAVTPFFQKFLEALEGGKLMKSKCPKCGAEYLPPRQHCQKDITECELTEETEREAKLYSYVIVDFAPASLSSKQPYIVAIGEFPSGLRLTAHITNPMGPPTVGMPLKLVTYKWLV